jgi:hypothetical protein
MPLIKKLILFLLFILFEGVHLYAVNTPFQFLRFNSNARAAGIAGCFEAMPDDPGAIFFNPATISTVEEKHFSATFLKHVLDINSGNVVYIRKFKNLGTFGAAVSFTNYGSFIRSDRYGSQIGSFSANDLIVSATYSNQLDTNLYYGISIKYLYNNIDKYNSSSIAFDAGLIYQIPDSRTNIGLSVLHAGAQLTKYVDFYEPLPLDVRFGVNNRLRGLPLLVNLSIHHLADESDSFFDKFLNFSIGGEFYFGEYVQARLGYDNQIRRKAAPQNDKQFTGLSAGIGIKTNTVNVDYAIAQYGYNTFLHRIGINLDF